MKISILHFPDSIQGELNSIKLHNLIDYVDTVYSKGLFEKVAEITNNLNQSNINEILDLIDSIISNKNDSWLHNPIVSLLEDYKAGCRDIRVGDIIQIGTSLHIVDVNGFMELKKDIVSMNFRDYIKDNYDISLASVVGVGLDRAEITPELRHEIQMNGDVDKYINYFNAHIDRFNSMVGINLKRDAICAYYKKENRC